MATGPSSGAGSTLQSTYPPPDALAQLQAPINSQFSCYPPDATVMSCEDPKAKFRNKFKTVTGMTVEESIALYKERTGEDLSYETVEKLFTDQKFARKELIWNKNLHRTYRDILNTNIPASKSDIVDGKYNGRRFKEMSTFESLLHNPKYNPWRNSKWVSEDGHSEVVFDPDGNLVSSNDYKGTFNFFGPDNKSGHIDADMIPYGLWGN